MIRVVICGYYLKGYPAQLVRLTLLGENGLIPTVPKILLADDSTHAQRMGAKILSGEGIEVVAVSNGDAAVKKLQESEFDLVLADVYMPGLDGYEVCQWVKKSEDHKRMPVVLVVGALELYEPGRVEQVAADGLLKKPFEASAMLATLRPLLAAAESKPKSKKEPEPEAAVAAHEKTVAIPPPAQAKPAMDDTVEIEPLAPAETATTAAAAPTPEPAPPMVEMAVAAPEPALEFPPVLEHAPLPHSEAVMEMPALELPVVEEAKQEAMEIPSMDGIYPAEAAPVEAPEAELAEAIPAATEAPAAQEQKGQWVAEPAQVTEQDEAKFAEAAPAPPPDWGDLLRSVEDGTAAAPALELDIPQPPAPEPPPPPPPPPPQLDEEELRMAVQLCLENSLPRMVDEIASAVLRRIPRNE